MQAYPVKERCYSAEEEFEFEKDFNMSKDEVHQSKGLTMHTKPSHNYGREEDFKFKEEFKSSEHGCGGGYGLEKHHDGYGGGYGLEKHHDGYGGGYGLEKHHDGYGGGYGLEKHRGHLDGYGSQSESWSFEKEKHHDGYSSHGGGYGGYGGMGHRKVGGCGAPCERVEEYRYYSEQRRRLPAVWESKSIKD